MTIFQVFRIAALASAAIASPLAAQRVAPAVGVGAATTTWQSRGSDVPVDPAWRLGTLPNGVRYAVRRSVEPAGAISVRVRIGVGGLMESDAQQGWSHLVEHMVFRGTDHYADGEGIRLWQRLGASFGSDTNAQTTLSATTFQLDLPHPAAADHAQAMAVLAEMMDSARFDAASLATERRVVEAELAQRLSPLVRKVKDARQPLFFAGTKAATRDVIGTPETLAGASAPALRDYYERWYRPDNAVVVVVGDADPATLEAGIARAFGGWKPSGATPPAPDWGAPAAPTVPVALVADPQAPDTLVLSFVAPHPDGPFTIARQQRQFAEMVAANILNQRLAAAAREDKAIINAGTQRIEQPHVEDQFVVAVQPRPGQWHAALDQAYAVVNGILAHPPTPAEIAAQTAVVANIFDQAERTAATEPAPSLATGFVTDVDNGDVSGPPNFYVRLFAAGRPALTPEAITATLKRLLAPAPRLLVLGPKPVAGGTAEVAAALTAAQGIAGGTVQDLRAVSLDQLVLPGTPARIGAVAPVAALAAERVMLGNGVELVVKPTAFEKGRLRVRVEVGAGLLGEAPDAPGLWWTAGALAGAGIGPFSAEELARVVAGHQYGFAVGAGLDGLVLTGTSDGDDLRDMLTLMTGLIVAPRFDATVVDRLRTSALANYASVFSQPMGVLQAFGGTALHGGDRRFDMLPSRDAITALTLADFRAFWTRRLAQGPVRVTIVGDIDRARAAAAVADTLGRLAPRVATPARQDDVRARAPARPVTLRHQGNADQALALLAWPTLGEAENAADSAALDIAARLVQTDLTETFRATEGGSYSPFAGHAQSDLLPHYGVFVAGAQVQAARMPAFRQALARAIGDLAGKGPSPDAFARAQATVVSEAQRRRENNAWWLEALGTLSDQGFAPARVADVAAGVARLQAVDAPAVTRAMARYLPPTGSFAVEVLPAPASAPVAGQ